MQYLLLGILFGSATIIWTLPFVLLKVFGISLYVVKDQKKIEKILDKINDKISSTITKFEYGEIKKGGVFGSRNMIGYLHEKGDQDDKKGVTYELFFITRKKYFDELLSDKVDNNSKIDVIVDQNLEVIERDGSFFRLYYNKRNILFNDIEPNFKQNQIITNILEFYKKNKYCVSFIQGLPGCGKTTIAYFLARELNGTLCKSFKPTDPGDNISNLIERSKPTSEKPLIILFDEVNIMIRKIHDLMIQPHKHIPISVYDKSTFNSFLDDMKFNKNIILIMTSNETREQIDLLDKSYIREGRVNVYSSI